MGRKERSSRRRKEPDENKDRHTGERGMWVIREPKPRKGREIKQ